jgi:hypothetical protein
MPMLFKYVIAEFNQEDKLLHVLFETGQHALVPLGPVFPTTRAELDGIIKQFVDSEARMLALQTPEQPDLSFIRQIVGVEQQAERLPYKPGEQPPAQPDPEPPLTLDELKLKNIDQVDTHIAAIYGRFTRFRTEYERREAAARAYAVAGYAGDPGIWVKPYADSIGVDYRQAVDTIIGQADQLMAALEQLAALRMRKYMISSAATAEQVNAVMHDILEEADAIAITL